MEGLAIGLNCIIGSSPVRQDCPQHVPPCSATGCSTEIAAILLWRQQCRAKGHSHCFLTLQQLQQPKGHSQISARRLTLPIPELHKSLMQWLINIRATMSHGHPFRQAVCNFRLRIFSSFVQQTDRLEEECMLPDGCHGFLCTFVLSRTLEDRAKTSYSKTIDVDVHEKRSVFQGICQVGLPILGCCCLPHCYLPGLCCVFQFSGHLELPGELLWLFRPFVWVVLPIMKIDVVNIRFRQFGLGRGAVVGCKARALLKKALKG
mmetsp:Transcript_50965/g.95379  ORF Transcript_50965/g.95379 Transcript_50965/m.95379 type:complete len:262 (+) Transcript_50965:391-1176(+)